MTKIQARIAALIETLPAPKCKCETIAEMIGESPTLVALYMLVILNKNKESR